MTRYIDLELARKMISEKELKKLTDTYAEVEVKDQDRTATVVYSRKAKYEAPFKKKAIF